MRLLPGLIGGALLGAGTYVGLVTGAAPIDLGIGRRLRRLGPLTVEIDASRDIVFDVVSGPYAERRPAAMDEKVQVLERSPEMVLAAHYTPIRGRLKATTVETVRFERPHTVSFRLIRGPVPYVVETFRLSERDSRTTLTYDGQLGTDLWSLGQRWGEAVAGTWESVVAESFTAVKTEAERLHRHRSGTRH